MVRAIFLFKLTLGKMHILDANCSANVTSSFANLHSEVFRVPDIYGSSMTL